MSCDLPQATMTTKSLTKNLGSDDVTGEEETTTLPELFDLAFNLHQFLEKTDESLSSDAVQGRLREGLLKTERAIRMVNDLDLFSVNEDIDEVSSNEIKYMLLSAFLGHFAGLNSHSPRKDAVTRSKLCYCDFLRLLKSYSVIEYDVGMPEEDQEEDSNSAGNRVASRAPDLAAMSAQRNNKIQRFKEKKELEKKMAELKPLVEREHVDDEVKREFYISQLKHWANVAIEEVDNCNLELQVLKHKEDMAKPGTKNQIHTPASKPKPFRPFILTKTELQKRVFGAGYPSLPTMTVDEFYEEKLKEGTLSEAVQGHSLQDWARNPEKDAEDREKEDAEKEEKMDREDPEELARARAMDDWKDDHRRGDGNRHNKG